VRSIGIYDAEAIPAFPTVAVVVITQNKEVANKLCGLNNGQRVASLTLTGRFTRDKTLPPKWNGGNWECSLLIEADLEMAMVLIFLVDVMTPLGAKMAAATSLHKKTTGTEQKGESIFSEASRQRGALLPPNDRNRGLFPLDPLLFREIIHNFGILRHKVVQ
jgi:hypothetical protein